MLHTPPRPADRNEAAPHGDPVAAQPPQAAEQAERTQPPPEWVEPPDRPARFEILIARDGTASLNGERIPAADGEEVHVTVLDAVHRAARDRGEPVDATILDLRENGYATHIRVAPDGSSQLLVAGSDEALHAEAEHAVGAGTTPDPHAEPPPVPPTPEPSAPGPPTLGPPAPGPSASDPSVPGELAEAVAHINRAAAGGEQQRAMVLAFRLREHAVRTYGQAHPYALEARDLEGYIARLAGNYVSATATYLELTRICHGQGSPRVQRYLNRAAANWQMLDNPQALLFHGQALLDLWSALAEGGGPGVPDAELPTLVHRRLEALAAELQNARARTD